MADREQAKKPQGDIAGKPTATSGSRGQERDHGVKEMGSVGRDVPDQSKERNTEIAVEAGNKAGHKEGERRRP